MRSRRHFRSKSLTGSILRASISPPAPNSFRHVSHVGVNRAGVFEVSKTLDASFRDTLVLLQNGTGADTVIVQDNTDFSNSFWKDVDSLKAASLDRDFTSQVPIGVAC